MDKETTTVVLSPDDPHPERTIETLVNNYLMEFGKELEAEADAKVTKAMRLWLKCDVQYRNLVLRMIGFDMVKLTKPDGAKQLRDWFDTMDLMDTLDNAIENMEAHLENTVTRK